MTSINDAFPSKYIKAADLNNKNHIVVMARTEFEAIGNEQKLILYFQNKPKGMVLNKVNATVIAKEYGDDTDDWVGKEIVLFPAMVDFKGETVAAIRVRRPAVKDRPSTEKKAASNAELSDEVPF